MQGAGDKIIGTVVVLACKTVPIVLATADEIGVKFTRKGVLSINQRSNQVGKVFAKLFSKSGKSFCGAFFKKRPVLFL